MLREDFDRIFKKITDVYGEKYFPAERQVAIWDIFHTCSPEDASRVFDLVIAEHFQPPAASKFKTAKDQLLSAATFSSAPLSVGCHYDCSHCGQSGFVYTSAKSDQRDVMFRCSCEFGNNKQNFRKWDASHVSNYIPDFYKYDESPTSDPKKLWHKGYGPRSGAPVKKYDVASMKAGPDLPYDPSERHE